VAVVLKVVADDQGGPVAPFAVAAEPLAGAEGVDGHAVAEDDRVAAPERALADGVGIGGGELRIF
jgi:hypothetical protein